MSHHLRRPKYSATSLASPTRLWLLRLLVPLCCIKEFYNGHSGFSDIGLAEALGFREADGCEEQEIDEKAVRRQLKTLLQQAENDPNEAKIPSCLRENVQRLSTLAGLSDVDSRILELTVLINNDRLLQEATNWLGILSTAKTIHALSVLLDIAIDDVRDSLSPQGVLARSGLVALERAGLCHLESKLQLLSDQFSDCICFSEADPISLLRDMVIPGPAPILKISDYPHISDSLSVLMPYLKQALGTGKHGVNVLIHGAPGTGKSQLCRLLASELGSELFEITSEDSEGDPIRGDQRLRAYRCTQSFLAQKRSLIQFDEVEDVLSDDDYPSSRRSTVKTKKAWINRILEENPLPTLWVSNSIAGLDDALIRRFDMIIELPIPPKRQREKIIAHACGDIADMRLVRLLAESESLAPAVVARAAAVVRTVQDELGKQCNATLSRLVSSTLEAQGHAPIKMHSPSCLPEFYTPHFVNSDIDLLEVAQGFAQSRSGRACLYGPPGTGKTAYGRWLAEFLDAPLMIRRASDLMSKWVGENEKNIARAFRQAEQEDAVLLIDEVDSFLQDRRESQRSWEVSLVNELLTQMEAFPGVFIASTNLMTALDPAALRRFDLKIKFDFMRPPQSEALLEKHCEELHLPPPTTIETRRIRQLDNLTPGDFAAILRQHRLRPLTSVDALIDALEAECALKEGHKSAIGFV